MESNCGWPMRVLGWVLLVLWLPGRVWASPEPPPPGDYPGAQYIDRSGCVFVRQGNDWTPRLDGQNAPVCGFPPSQPALAEAPLPPPSPEAVLTDILSQGLQPGDLVATPAPEPLAAVSPDPAQAELDAALARQIDLDARMRSVLGGSAPQGLCARLGYRGNGGTAPVIGGDVTQGLCPGMTVHNSPMPRIVAATPTPQAMPVTAPADRPARSDPEPAVPSQPSAAVPERPASVVARRPARAQVEKSAVVEMIPPHARYVQIGVYADEGNALAALRRLSQMGYRTAQRQEAGVDGPRKAILAGPFADRQALVSALTRLRANGYPRALAR